MKKFLFVILALASTINLQAQPDKNSRPQQGGQKMRAERKFQIIVHNESNVSQVENDNAKIQRLQDEKKQGNTKGLLSDLLKTAYSSSFVQKTTNASSNLLSLGVSYLSEALTSKRAKWLKTVQSQCHFEKSLSSERKIEDFYALPSTQGAMDPQNMKFDGFGCRHFLEVKDKPGDGQEVFYLYCGMKKDDEGIKSIVNHSKFLVDVDTLVFNPLYCNLPNDSTGADLRFDFDRRKDLTFKVKVTITSSWINELVQVVNNQKIGEFTITARIEKSLLNSDGLFVYDKNNPRHRECVSVQGDCFIVPRSFTGTTDATTYKPAWGTGQYTIDMQVVEDCKINEDFYLVKTVGNGEQVAFAQGAPGKKKWDKNIWKQEWNDMNARKKNKSFWQNAYEAIKTAYVGDSWITTITDPLGTSLYSWETQKLNKWLDLDGKAVSATGGAGKSSSAAGAKGAGSGAQPTGGQGGAPAGGQGGTPPTGGQGGTPQGGPGGTPPVG